MIGARLAGIAITATRVLRSAGLSVGPYGRAPSELFIRAITCVNIHIFLARNPMNVVRGHVTQLAALVLAERNNR